MTEERVPFSVVRQAPSSYHVENGQILKHMAVIFDIRDMADTDPPQTQASLNDVAHVVSPPNIIRYDVKAFEGAPAEADRVRELKFEVEESVINIYETQDHIILVASMVQKIFLTNKVDAQNNPVLQCMAQVALNTIPKPIPVQQDS